MAEIRAEMVANIWRVVAAEGEQVDNTLRQYLYDKYIFRSNGHSASPLNTKEEKL